MLVFLIIMHLILILLWTLLIIRYKKIDKICYELCTRPSKIVNTLIYTLYFVLLIVEFYKYFSGSINKSIDFDTCFGWSIRHLFLLLILYINHFYYEAIKGDNVYVHRFFGIKTFKISDIQYTKSPVDIVFVESNKHYHFKVLSHKPGVSDFLLLLNKKKRQMIDEPYEKANLISIGKEYRENYKKYKNKFVLGYLTHTIYVALIISGLGLMLRPIQFPFILTVPYVVIKLIVFCVIIIEKKEELKLDDLSLGNKNKYANKNVKGAQMCFLNIIAIQNTLRFVCFMGLAALAWLFYDKPKSYNDLTTITMEFKEYEKSEYRNILILKSGDIEKKYYLDNYFQDYYDFTFLDEIKEGDTITLLVDYSEIYEIHFNKKDYFTYSDYLKGYDEHFRGDEIMYYSLGVSLATVIEVIAAGVICTHKEKSETIDV